MFKQMWRRFIQGNPVRCQQEQGATGKQMVRFAT
jgi:hypothetical protein